MKKRVLSLLLVALLCLMAAFPVFAKEADRVVDDANLLSKTEEKELRQTLDELSEEFDADFVVVTKKSLRGKSIDDCAEELFEDQYGQGDERSGLLLLVAMDEGECWVYPGGECKDTFSESTCESIAEDVASYLSDEEYAAAFDTFVQLCRKQYEFPAVGNLVICLVIGLVVALIATGVMRSKLKTVRKQDTANQYTKSGSMRVTTSSDLFLYRNVTRVRKAENSSGSGTGSSNRGGGAKF